jgi:hypothetical protein
MTAFDNNKFAQALKGAVRSNFTNFEKIGTWSYNNSPIVAIQRSEGWVIMVLDGASATIPAIKGKSWLSNIGTFTSATTSLFLDDSKISNPAPTAAELDAFRTATGVNTGTGAGTSPIVLTPIVPSGTVQTGTQPTADTPFYKKPWGIGAIIGAVIALGGLTWYALKGK